MEANEGPGRPTKYKPEYCDKLIEHMTCGLSFESFGAIADVCKQTLYTWIDAQPEFLDAKNRGLEKCRLFWERLGVEHAVSRSDSEHQGGSSSRSLNSAVWGLNMQNRFGWRQKQPGEDDKKVTHAGEIKVANIDWEERAKQLKGEE